MIVLLLACVPVDPGKPTPSDSARGDSPGDSHADSATTPTPPDSADDTAATDTATTVPGPSPAVRFTGDRPVNLLVISIDTTRRDQLGVFSGLDTTPFLDTLLAESVLLEDHRTCSNWTLPSVACATTGAFPLDDGWWPTATYDGNGDSLVAGIPDELPTLAAILLAEGYHTSLVTGNPLLTSTNKGIVSGFETVVKRSYQGAPTIAQVGIVQARQLLATGTPWYLHLHFMDPHGPYVAPEEYAYELPALEAKYPDFAWDVTRSSDVYDLMGYWPYLTDEESDIARQFLFAVYRAELRYWDATFADLWAQLDAMGALDDTLVVFWSDHGEQFGEHGGFQHGVSLNAQENRSTAAFWARDIVPAAWAGPTLHQDVPPTVLDALGLPPEPDQTGIVVGLAPDDRTRLTFDYLVGYAPVLVGATKSGRQLLYSYAGSRSYHDLAADPEGDVDLYDPTDPEVVALWGELGPTIERLETLWPHLVPVRPEP